MEDTRNKKTNSNEAFLESLDAAVNTRPRRKSTLHTEKNAKLQGMPAPVSAENGKTPEKTEEFLDDGYEDTYDPDFDEAGDEAFASMGGDYTDENGLDPDFDYCGPEVSAEAVSGAAGTAERSDAGRNEAGHSRADHSKGGHSKAGRGEEGGANGREKKARELNSASTAINAKTVREAQEKKKKSRVRKIVFWTVLECITLAVIFIYGYFLRAWNLISRPEVNEENIENNNISLEKKQEMERGWWTVAVFGVDGRSASDLVSKGLNSDVIIIVNVNQDTGEIRLCSVFRDTYLNISKDDDELYRKINAAYCNGGPEQALAALNKNLDLNIKNYVTFNWKAVADGINILGGVDGIDISKAELYYINAFITETVNVTGIGSHQLTSTGTQHLDGVQAVAYGRLRLMDSDYARVERQKKVIKACFEKAKQANFSVLNNIMVVCFPEVATNINFNEVVAMAQNITKYNITETGGFPWMRSETANSKIGDVIVPATLESNVIKLHEFLFDDAEYEPSSACLHYSETIKEKTGIYKEGQVVESVRTDGGLISTPRTSEAETEEGSVVVGEKATEAESETDEDGNIIEKPTIGVDSNGNYVYPTNADGEIEIPRDRNGNVLYPTDEYGNIIYETDAEGNVVNPTNADGSPYTTEETRPSETAEADENGPAGETSHADDETDGEDGPEGPGGRTTRPADRQDADGPGAGTTASATTEYNGPGSSTKESTTKESDTKTAGEQETTGGKPTGIIDDGGSSGPGGSSQTSSGTSSDGPGSGTESSGTSGGPGSDSSSGSDDGPAISPGDGPG